MSTVYGDVPKPKSNLDLCTNPVDVPVPWPPLLFPSGSLMLRESKKNKERENEGFIGGFLGLSVKRGKRVQLLKLFFQLNYLIQGYG